MYSNGFDPCYFEFYIYIYKERPARGLCYMDKPSKCGQRIGRESISWFEIERKCELVSKLNPDKVTGDMWKYNDGKYMCIRKNGENLETDTYIICRPPCWTASRGST